MKKKKPAKKPAAKNAKKKPLAFEILGDYFEGVAANTPTRGLEDALQICIDMYAYDMPDELARLKREATSALRDGRMPEALALVKKWKIENLDLERALEQIVEADRYVGPAE